MSVNTIKEEFCQSTARKTIREKCQAIFNQELLSDVKFVVRDSLDSQSGRASKTIPAHKFVLAISSPVFYAMFCGGLAETKHSVEISDCKYESLLELFRFMYSDEANLNPDNVMQLLYLAKKYMLPSLVNKCSAYLQENVDASNVFHVLPDAQKFEEKDLLDYCWRVIEKETEEAVKSDGFVTIERLVLEQLVENDSLEIKEVELFKAVDCWAGKECEKQGVVAEGSVKRRILGERIVKGIRFREMEQNEFVKVVLDSDILTKQECFDMIKYFNCPSDASGAGSLNQAQNIVCRFKSISPNSGWFYSSTDSIGLKVDQDINLHEVRFFGRENSEYSVILSVHETNLLNGVSDKATKKGKFLSRQVESEAGYYPGFAIVFNPPFTIKSLTDYRLDARITGPPSLYGKRGLHSVEQSGVKFTFASYTSTLGSHSTLDQGQFSEFVFTLV